jgi:hypothetical protein
MAIVKPRRPGPGKRQVLRPVVVITFFLVCTFWWFFVYKSSSGLLMTNDKDEKSSLCTMGGPPVPTFKVRDDLGKILQNEKGNFTKGIELGVQVGYYSHAILSHWSRCKEYHLVDLWAPQENYKDYANVDQERQDQNYEATLTRLDEWKGKLHVCRNFTSTCVQRYKDEYFDFIYVDARHDFKGVLEDLINYWPKLRVGGILAGHDYVTQEDVGAGQDWTTNYDGTIDETGTVVKGAVDKFANSVCRQVTVSYREGNWNTWAIRK